MPIFYLIEFRLAKGKKKGTTGVPSRFWGQKFLKTGNPAGFFDVITAIPYGFETRLSERHELEKPERLDGVGLFTVLDLELK